jgi:TolB-like protein/DNA-binding winged helix-turn-helix (wHTH) protein
MVVEQPITDHAKPAYETIDGWFVDYTSNCITKSGSEVRLEPKVMDVLACLARRAGEVVTRQQFESEVWAGRIVSEDALTNAIRKLRRAFRDDPRQPKVIETIPKVGYRLTVPVKPSELAPARARTAARTEEPHRLYWRVFIAALVFFSVLAGFLLWVFPLPPADAPKQPIGIGPPLPDSPSLVVLPFENLGTTPEQDYFAAGITADLITALSKVSGLFVVAPHSAFSYRASPKLERIIGQELGVRHVLIGSVRKSDNRVRITVRLADSLGDHVLWAEHYDRDLSDIFRIQDEVTSRIVGALRIQLAHDERSQVGKRYTAAVEAYDLFLRGLDHYAHRSKEDNRIAKEYYEQAIRLDPSFARAYGSLALAHLRDTIDAWSEDPNHSLERAGQLVAEALRIDESIPQVHFAKSQVALFRRDYMQAIRDAEKAVALDPNYADAYGLLAWVLHYAGRPDQALEPMQNALRLNPHAPSVYLTVHGGIYFTLGRYDKALRNFRKALAINPTTQRLRLWIAATYAQAGFLDDAQWEATELLALNPELSLDNVTQDFPFKDQHHMDNFLNGLRKAGLLN